VVLDQRVARVIDRVEPMTDRPCVGRRRGSHVLESTGPGDRRLRRDRPRSAARAGRAYPVVVPPSTSNIVATIDNHTVPR
jgi:hypothetical protein